MSARPFCPAYHPQFGLCTKLRHDASNPNDPHTYARSPRTLLSEEAAEAFAALGGWDGHERRVNAQARREADR